MEITYTNHEGFYLPNLTLPRKEEASFGRYGRLRLKYLKEHRRALYINLLTSSELAQHLNEVDQQAREMLELLVKQIAQEQDITEQMKAEDQMAWVGAMNNIRSAAEEVVIYKRNSDYGRMMDMLCSYTVAGKNKHDDVPDGMAMLAEFSQALNGAKVEVFRRPC